MPFWRVDTVMTVGDPEQAKAVRLQADFADFYGRELAGQVRRAALLLGSAEQANDVVHDAFVAVYRRWDELGEPGPYLNVAVLNGCRAVHRRRSRYDRLVPRLFERATSAPDDVLADVLGRLPFNHRAAVVLRYYGGLTTDEIASSLGCAPGSVGPWIDRALAAMRKALT
jgi:RNA polymerase sigma factor (sigma-70 family)